MIKKEEEEDEYHLIGEPVTGDPPEFRSSDEKKLMENARVRQRRKKSESCDGGGNLGMQGLSIDCVT
ncbi:hypothetical protein E5676_scaffold434G005200 [Cucumis melo var. makuwa]|uniref:Uncharacterized protein n=2 Tax=Cucumis melo TaxID=3656 RepID=A0A5D3D2C8_CUCMM|nr:hypothetical protein E6C27_scaffold171G001390 [Cucumis melo var. makuwa]TYK17648.1 hypothetical protein E5676_scaffold434G005200 [Cucumis melo var. makuwa]